ncbi:MAG: hypothetical protein RR420_00885 [Anaerovoracaceae bacterium]
MSKDIKESNVDIDDVDIDDVDIDKIIVKYTDGTEKEIDKGVAVSVTKGIEENTFKMDMKNISGQDLTMLIQGFLELGIKMGMFDRKDDVDDEGGVDDGE